MSMIFLMVIAIFYLFSTGDSQNTAAPACVRKLSFCEQRHAKLQTMLDDSLVKLARLQERSVELQNLNNIKQNQIDVLLHQINNPGKAIPNFESKLVRASPLPLAKLRDLLTRIDAPCSEKLTQCRMATSHGESQFKEEQYRLNETSTTVMQNEEKNKMFQLQIYQLSEQLKSTRGL